VLRVYNLPGISERYGYFVVFPTESQHAPIRCEIGGENFLVDWDDLDRVPRLPSQDRDPSITSAICEVISSRRECHVLDLEVDSD
jgi:hypothetical protein